jgi:hypothetical protein
MFYIDLILVMHFCTIIKIWLYFNVWAGRFFSLPISYRYKCNQDQLSNCVLHRCGTGDQKLAMNANCILCDSPSRKFLCPLFAQMQLLDSRVRGEPATVAVVSSDSWEGGYCLLTSNAITRLSSRATQASSMSSWFLHQGVPLFHWLQMFVVGIRSSLFSLLQTTLFPLFFDRDEEPR